MKIQHRVILLAMLLFSLEDIQDIVSLSAEAKSQNLNESFTFLTKV